MKNEKHYRQLSQEEADDLIGAGYIGSNAIIESVWESKYYEGTKADYLIALRYPGKKTIQLNHRWGRSLHEVDGDTWTEITDMEWKKKMRAGENLFDICNVWY